jgi:hypothetical protein
MIVRDATPFDIRAVVDAMRAVDAREIYAGRWSDSPEDLIADLLAIRPHFLALKSLCIGEWEPAAIVGALRRGPGVASVVMIGTDRFAEIGAAATFWVRSTGLPRHVDPHAHRAQCEAAVDNDVSRRWLEALGFENEGVLRSYGKNGEDFVQYARIVPKRGAWPPLDP